MDLGTKRKKAEAVRRAFSRLVESSGYSRTKTTFWTVPHSHFIQFIHLHLFSFMPAFGVHLGIRVLNDDFPASALNGLHSQDGWGVGARRYEFRFNDSNDSVSRCATELAAFVDDVARPWFDQFHDENALLNDPQSPLKPAQKRALELSIRNDAEQSRVDRSKELLGVA